MSIVQTFDEPVQTYIIEKDTLLYLIEKQHRFDCLMYKGNDTFEYFYDMLSSSEYERNMSHQDFVEFVKHMDFKKLAEIDLSLYAKRDIISVE